jgi:uncharacterized protein DUF6493
MAPKEQLTHIVEKSRLEDIIPFLQSLSIADRKALVPEIKKLHKYYWELITTDIGSYSFRGSQAQFHILSLASLACSDLKDFEKISIAGNIFKKDLLYAIFQWYIPSWFSEYINRLAGQEWLPFDYDFLMDLTEKGYAKPGAELIAKTLPMTIRRAVGQEILFTPEILEKRPVTLDEHIWYLFEYECGVNWTVKLKDSENIEANWTAIFRRYSDNGRISRDRVLRESIAASAKSFTKPLCGWFADLFTSLDPAKQELLAMQQILMSVLSAPQSKPVNTVLNYFKKLSEDPSFDADAFLQQAHILLAGDVKSISVTTLNILEILARKDPDIREQTCIVTMEAFISKDATIQTKAAKLISKYGNTGSVLLSEAACVFDGSLLSAAKEIMSPWLKRSEKPLADGHMAAGKALPALQTFASRLSSENEIPVLRDVEELIFLISQAMDNNQPYHFEQILSGVLLFHPAITESHFQQMLPAMQRAFKITLKGISGNAGHLEELLALFLIEYGLHLSKKFPAMAVAFDKQYNKSVLQEDELVKSRSYYTRQLIPVEKWLCYKDSNGAYEPYKQLTLVALQHLRLEKFLPLLSMSTHTGGWIDPVLLVERMAEYQLSGIQPAEIDTQLAISRVAFENAGSALSITKDRLSGEYRELMLFLLDRNMEPAGSLECPALWMMAALTKTPEKEYAQFSDFPYNKITRAYLTGQFDWETYIEKYQAFGDFNQEKKDYERYEAERPKLRIKYPAGPNIGVKKSYYLDTLKYTFIDKVPLLPEYMYDHRPQAYENDMLRVMSVLPNHPDVLLANTIDSCMSSASLMEVQEKKMVLRTLEAIHLIKPDPCEIFHLFIATAMLNADDTCRAVAAEIWIDRVPQGSIDSERMGAIIGTHQRIEWAPMKRFTDLVAGRMQKISANHNEALEKMLTVCLLQLPATGIKDLKKILEIFHETSVNNGRSAKMNTELISKLREWKEFPSVKKTVADILK